MKRPVAWRRLRSRVRRIRPDAPIRIVIGAHGIFEPGWLPTDRESLNVTQPNDWERIFGERRVDAMLAEHVWEHLSPDDALNAARLCREYLAPGGHMRIAVPDGLHPSPDYIEWVKVGGIGPAAWDHKALYDYRSLPALFESAGLEVDLLEYWDETGQFAHNDWDPEDGMVHRSWRYHKPKRPQPFRYTSLILDARRGPTSHAPSPGDRRFHPDRGT